MEPLDPQVVNLAKAIRQSESGGDFKARGKSGEVGAYQFTKDTWNAQAPKYGIKVPIEQATPEQQNEVAYRKIKEWKDSGKNVGQVASMWNAGEGEPDAYTGKFSNGQPSTGVNKFGAKFDVPTYAKSVASAYQTLKTGGQVNADPQNPSSTANKTPLQPVAQEGYKPTFTANQGDSPLMAGAKAIGNVPGSAFNFAKGLVKAFNPLETLGSVSQIPEEFKKTVQEYGGVGKALAGTAKEIPKALYEGLVPQGIRQTISGDISGAAKTFTEDPFGQVAPVVLAATGGAKIADTMATRAKMAEYAKSPYTEGAPPGGGGGGRPIPQPVTKYSQALDTGISKTAQSVTKPIKSAVGGILDIAKGSALSSATTLTSLPASGIVQALKHPETMSKISMENASRGGLAGELKTVIDSRIKDLSDTGKGYDAVRKSNQTVQVPDKFIETTLTQHGLKIKGKRVVADTNSITRNTSDLNAINKFYKDWGSKKNLTPNEFLNMRADLAELSKFDKLTGMGKTRASETVGKSLYENANRTMRDNQLQELKALDDTYSPETQFLKQVKRDYLNPDGTLKDGAGNKIANAGNKAQLLGRLEGLIPGITKKIELLKVIEDVKHANEGFKVGAYTRGGLVGGALLSGNIPAIIASIITSPGNALQILRSAGYVGAKVAPILKYLQAIAGDVNVLKSPYMQKGLQSGVLKQSVENNTP